MRRAVWGIVILGLLFCGCEKKPKEIYIYQTDTLYVEDSLSDTTPPKVEIISPNDGETLYMEHRWWENDLACWGISFVVQYICWDNGSLLKSIYLNGEKQNTNDLEEQEFSGKFTFRYYCYGGWEGIEVYTHTFTVKAYDWAGNMGWDSVRVTVKQPE